jgi:hypothetical protein
MDPVSLSLGLAGILPLVANAITSAKRYMDAVATAKKSIAILITELEALQRNVVSLQELLKADDLSCGSVIFRENSVLLSCSAACETKLRILCNKLGQEANGKRSRFLWPFSEKEHQKTVQELRNFTIWMQFALSVDGCRLLSRTSDDVLKLMAQQLDQFRTIQSLEASTLQIYDVVKDQKRILEASVEQETRKTILDWISSVKNYQKHQVLQLSREENTGTWLLRREEYLRWRDGLSSSKILWCYGNQGSGKTNLV